MEDRTVAKSYRWTELSSDKPMSLLERQRIIGMQAMISRVLLKKGCVVPSHRHENEQFACILSGALRFGLGSEGSQEHRYLVVSAGEVLHLPSLVPHSAEAIEETVVLDIFAPPSETTGIDERH